MSKQALEDFRAKLAQDEALRAELRSSVGVGAGEDTGLPLGSLVEFAQGHGYDFDIADVQAAGELGEDELDHVSGGVSYYKLGVVGPDTQVKDHKGWSDILSFDSFVSPLRR